jgi:enoyl-CoA hydratase/carnithine racemase
MSHSLSLLQSKATSRWHHSTKWFRNRNRLHLEVPPATEVLSKAVINGVFEMQLSGGKRLNVLGRSTIDRIDLLVANPPKGTQVIVITAEPPDFCAGYDLVEAAQGNAADLIAHEKNFAALRQSKIPIIVALQGNVIGGGLELALLADIRLASPETILSIPASKIGLVYSEAGIRSVVEAVGDGVARSLFLGGREISANSAFQMGLVTEIIARDQLRESAVELATLIASWSNLATSGNRQILDVIAGRISVNTQDLRTESFARNGDLTKSIADFVARRKQSYRRPIK